MDPKFAVPLRDSVLFRWNLVNSTDIRISRKTEIRRVVKYEVRPRSNRFSFLTANIFTQEQPDQKGNHSVFVGQETKFQATDVFHFESEFSLWQTML